MPATLLPASFFYWCSRAVVARRHFGVEYNYLDRQFFEHTAPLTNVYDPGLHPATLADVFLNRLQFDSRTGALPFDITPASKKQTHSLKGHATLPGDVSATGTFTSNDDLNFSTWSRTAHAPGAELWIVPGDRWSLTAGYTAGRERLDTMFSVLSFVG